MMRERLAFIAAVMAGLALAASAVEAGYLGPARQGDSEIAGLEADLAQLQARLASARAELSNGDTSQGQSLDSMVETGPSVAASAERLQGLVRDAVSAGGGQALSSQTGSSDLGGGYTKVALVLRARFDEPGLLAFLRQIEGQAPAILVEALDIQQMPMPGERRSLDVTANLAGVHADVAP